MKASTAFAFAWLIVPIAAGAAAPRVLPEGELPNDIRFGPLRTHHTECAFVPPKTVGEWTVRSERIRRQILVAVGLWPMPDKGPLNPVVTGRIDRSDYTVEKVYFESVPGFYVTGNLYRPKGRSGRLPGILCPHGHWTDGRFTDKGPVGVLDEIVHGAERFEEGGRSLIQARCVQLARMGCVVFAYDMIGYGDMTQIPIDIAHASGPPRVKTRPEMNTLENWGFYSAQAEAHLESIMGLQTWDSIRSVDFLLSLPDVDPARIGCTGESGGGTQTMILAAVDDRLKVAFPAVMVSGAMQGGCTCENASDLRIGTSNIEFAALFAPKPMGMTTANDWTRDMPTKGFPELRQLYGLLGAPDDVMIASFPQFGHNYNSVSRAPMYAWFNRHFRLGLAEPIVEKDYPLLSREEASVWTAAHPAPLGGPDFERALLRTMTADAAARLEAVSRSPSEFRRVAGGAVDVLIGRNLNEVGPVQWKVRERSVLDGYAETLGTLRNTAHGEELPAVRLEPRQWNGATVLWLDGTGKAALYADGAGIALKPQVRSVLDRGCAVIGADLFMQGEFLPYGATATPTRDVGHITRAPGYTFCYNSSLFAQRVQDILSLVKFAQGKTERTSRLGIVGLNGAGPLVAAAVAQGRGAFERAVIDGSGFRFGALLDVHDENFLPGGARYGDLPGMIALAGPTRVAQVDGRAGSLEPALRELLR